MSKKLVKQYNQSAVSFVLLRDDTHKVELDFINRMMRAFNCSAAWAVGELIRRRPAELDHEIAALTKEKES